VVIVDGIEYSKTLQEIVSSPSDWELDTREERCWFSTKDVPVTENVYFRITENKLEWWDGVDAESDGDNT
jgi:hypothetical protein